MADENDEPIVTTRRAVMEACAYAWDAAVKSLTYPDGSPVEVVSSTNPYRPTEEPR